MLARRALGGALLALASPALGQTGWPRRPVRLLVGFAPGGFTDIVARAIAEHYTQAFGVNVVVENRTGASGTLAADFVAKAPPDGSVLLLGHSTPNAVAAALFTNLPYDPLNDLTPIAQLAVHPHLLVVPASSPHRSTAELIAAARARPGSISYSSSGIGSVHHVACETLALRAEVRFVHVPYRGSAQSIADLIAGRVDMTIDGVSIVAGPIGEGRLRALAAGTLARIGRWPDLTTLQEQGYGDIDAMSWVGVFGPPGLPPALAEAAAGAAEEALATPTMRRVLEAGSSVPTIRTGAAFRDFVALEITRYKAVLGNSQIPL